MLILPKSDQCRLGLPVQGEVQVKERVGLAKKRRLVNLDMMGEGYRPKYRVLVALVEVVEVEVWVLQYVRGGVQGQRNWKRWLLMVVVQWLAVSRLRQVGCKVEQCHSRVSAVVYFWRLVV